MVFVLIALAALLSCSSGQNIAGLESRLRRHFEAQQGVFAVAFKDLSSGESLFINENEVFHAASTMKTAVMIEVYKQAAQGRWQLSDSVPVINDFTSIADGSRFSLRAEDDSEKELYNRVGKKQTLYNLVYDMIIRSSNLATNILIEYAEAQTVTRSMRQLGAPHIQVLRGVEDIRAYEKGMNNTITAYDLLVIFEKLATGQAVNAEASDQMIAILLDQQFNDVIPARLPPNVKVAHKTGFITGVHHDSGIVFLPDGRKYVLVLLSKNLPDINQGTIALARASEMIYEFMMQKSR
ncbi:MAG: hypothetical protein KatS3mg032_1690 [Cyclobacteriaceae bacterium]|nr:MAG: hypothetical protein KatS3mg032_1690 [Cyclobacteriaceae bacterium]